MSPVWMVRSAGLRLPVAGPDSLPAWWAEIAPHVPASEQDLGNPVSEAPALMLPAHVSVGDARRRISAGLHMDHLRHDTLSAHGVAVVRDGRAVLLVGGHGSGKSLTGLALITAHGWRAIAGDVCLIRVGRDGSVTVVGGTRSYVVRRREAGQWFPGLALPGCGPRADLMGPAYWYWPAGVAGVRLTGVISVSIGDVPGGPASERQSAQVTASAVCRASSYLVDKVLDDPDADPPRVAEDAELCRIRMRLARQVAQRTASWWMGGSPQAIAAEVTRVAREDGVDGQ